MIGWSSKAGGKGVVREFLDSYIGRQACGFGFHANRPNDHHVLRIARSRGCPRSRMPCALSSNPCHARITLFHLPSLPARRQRALEWFRGWLTGLLFFFQDTTKKKQRRGGSPSSSPSLSSVAKKKRRRCCKPDRSVANKGCGRSERGTERGLSCKRLPFLPCKATGWRGYV